MTKPKKPDINPLKLGKNPLLNNLKIVITGFEIPNQYKMVDGKKEQVEAEIERVGFTKVFSDAERRKAMLVLTPRAKDLLLWLMYEVEPNKDYLWLNKWRYMEESGIATYNTYNSAVNDLIANLYIAKVAGYSNVFWISPHFFFNGNRAKTFPEHVVKR